MERAEHSVAPPSAPAGLSEWREPRTQDAPTWEGSDPARQENSRVASCHVLLPLVSMVGTIAQNRMVYGLRLHPRHGGSSPRPPGSVPGSAAAAGAQEGSWAGSGRFSQPGPPLFGACPPPAPQEWFLSPRPLGCMAGCGVYPVAPATSHPLSQPCSLWRPNEDMDGASLPQERPGTQAH